ncbi:MAG: alpha-galactosidase, partial [Victivallales bacterium]|nr:alpha-galactosidase [Victivallales bacterium]
WGVGNFPKLLNEKFLIDEIKASAAVGATHYQIDDGWQAGGGLREISLNNRHVTPEFWKVSEKRLPEGFKNIDNEARKAGVELALWFAPSFNQEYRDWKEAADILTHFHRKHNIRMFKIDAVKIRTKTAEDNLRGMCEHLRDISKGEITFNFDTTNGQRPGYLMFLEYGNIFLENRYVHGAGIGYHPEDTLNNLWSLSRYLRTQTLQIEIPSHDDVNKEFYKSKDRLSPDLYPADYWAAIALFANPLLWLAPSKVSDALVCNYRKIIDLHLEHREAIFKGEISPVGLEPNGSEITGFISHNYTGASGYLLLFREIRATESAELSINRLKGMRFKTIHATCDCSISSDDKSHLIVRMMEPTSFALFQYESSETTV